MCMHVHTHMRKKDGGERHTGPMIEETNILKREDLSQSVFYLLISLCIFYILTK